MNNEKNRNIRIAKLIQKEIAYLFLKNETFLIDSAFITVSSVIVSNDARHATVVVNDVKNTINNDVIKFLNSISWYYRKILAQKLQLRYIPKINFKKCIN